MGMGHGCPAPHVAWVTCNLLQVYLNALALVLADMAGYMAGYMAQQVVQQRLAHNSNWLPCGLDPKAWLASLAMGMRHGPPAQHVAWLKCNLLQCYLNVLALVLADMDGYMPGYMYQQQLVQARLAHNSNWIPCGLGPKAWLASMGMGHGCPAPHVAWVKCNLPQGYLNALAKVLADMAGYMAQQEQAKLDPHSNWIPCGLDPNAFQASMGMGHGFPAQHVA